MMRAEEKHKLVMASMNFYKTAEQVCSVLESLEREYRRDEDWCESDKSVSEGGHGRSDGRTDTDEKLALLASLLNKHLEQKEAFLKACTLARRTAETFLKYVNRNLYNQAGLPLKGRPPDGHVKDILKKLMMQETTVLEYWTNKKKRLDHCNQYVTFEQSARKALSTPQPK